MKLREREREREIQRPLSPIVAMDGSHPPQRHVLMYVSLPVSSAIDHPSPYASSSATSSVHGDGSQGESNPPSYHTAGVTTLFRVGTKSALDFVIDTQPGSERMRFGVDDSRPDMLQVNFGPQSNAGLQQVYMKKASNIAFKGKIKFEPVVETEHGKKVITARGFVKATLIGGKAELYLADSNKVVNVLQLEGESITVIGDNILAFETSLEYKTVMMNELCKNFSAGVQLSGHGCVAILSRGKPLSLVIEEGESVVRTNPEATVAWSGNLNPDFETDVQSKGFDLGSPWTAWKRFLRRSGESVEMIFDPKKGRGYVVV